MLCYRCGSHAPDASQVCPACGQALVASGALTAGASPRRGAEGAPYRLGDLIGGRFRVEQVLGNGPLGWVMRAQDTKLGVEVALKSLHPHLLQAPEERDRFRRSMRMARKVSHPNLLRVYEEGEDAGRLYFTAQFIEGKSLRALLDERRESAQPFTLTEAQPLLQQMAQALDAIHVALTHGDFKPENVLLVPDVLKLTDVGLGGAMPTLPFVQAQRQARRDHYFAPEASDIDEDEKLEATADVYSLAVVMGEMLSGRTPADGAVPELSQLVPSLPSAIDGIYRRGLSINPLARYRTASDLVAELSALVGQEVSEVTDPTPTTAPGTASQPVGARVPEAPSPAPAPRAAAAPTLNDAPTQAMETPAWLLPGGSLDGALPSAKKEKDREKVRRSRAGAPAIDAGAATLQAMPAIVDPPSAAISATIKEVPARASGARASVEVTAPLPASEPALVGAAAPKLMVGSARASVGNQRVIATELLQVDSSALPELPLEEPRRASPRPRPPVQTDPGVRTPNFPQLVPPPGVASPRSPPPRKNKKRSELWLVVLAVLGVGLGVGAGMLLLRALRPTPTTAPLPAASQPAAASPTDAPPPAAPPSGGP